ncbi:MAG: hypothetical protein UW06_C0015G0018 [Parcubacteria group bacterium GW2011_GWE1_43_8]|nr:MAG: hypothetical protein UW06_C0015G0018 [Parcubacteria group bacterium GW2011_GWE1_43_8]
MITLFPQKLAKLTNFQMGALVFVLLFLLDIFSAIGWWSLGFSSVLTAVSVLAWVLVAIKNLPLGVSLLLVELIVGSFGRLTEFTFGSTEISLRLGLFIAAFGLMLYKIASDRQHIIFRHSWRWWFAGALAVLVWAAAWSYYNWNSLNDLFLDANGYLYILLLPLFLQAFEQAGQEKILHYARVVFIPAIIWLSVRTIVLLYLFTHFSAEALVPVYQWYRDSGLGEITPAGGGFFRVFSQSHIYASLASVIGFAWLWRYLGQNSKIPLLHPMIFFTLTSLITLIASLSRSLWLGAAAAWFLIPLLALPGKKLISLTKYLLISIILIASAAGMVLAVARVNWPVKSLGSASAQVFANRFGTEPAGQARLALLKPLAEAIKHNFILGRGFGATVLYYSTDPRAVAGSAGGSGFTLTYAFEWGWLDFWYKFGLIGLLVFTAWLAVPVMRGLKLWHNQNPAGAGALALVALYVTHLTTPYLNHPLGLGAVLALGTFVISSVRK